ncbi:MAG: amidohydrolase family protein [Bryobacterales bacterium]|nr:amidohydrolase family protein [Bryobacterales bacterium]
MRLDSATSLADRTRFVYPWTLPHMKRDFTTEDLWRILTRNRYEGALVTAFTGQDGETEWLLEQKAKNPWIKGVIGAPIEGVCALRCRIEDLDKVKDSPLPVDLILTPELLSSVPDRIGDRKVALVNLGGALYTAAEFEPWMASMKPLAALPNVSVKLSGLINDAKVNAWNAETYRPYVQFLLEAFGPDRLMYGSDWPNCMTTGTWKESLAAFTQALGPQSQETRNKLLGETAAKFYGLA